MQPKVYVVTEPERIRGVYETWAECKVRVDGVRGARYQSVDSRERAELLLGDGIILPSGTWIFTDGNAAGGVGIVVVQQDSDGAIPKEVSTSVRVVFTATSVPGLRTAVEVEDALARLHNILAELAALYHALRLVPSGKSITIVHDYEGVGAWMEKRWKTKDAIVKAIIEACLQEVDERELIVAYRHQRGHQSTWAGRDDFAHWNGRADHLATQSARSTSR